MAGPKFFVYGGSRWREVCTSSGRVNGWGNVQFLTVRCGRLQVARKSTVLRGLRSLAASQPTTAHDGPPLSQIRYNNSIEEKKEHDCLQHQHHHCCKQNELRYNSDVIFNNIFKAASTCSAAVQCSLEGSSCAPSSNKSIKRPNQTSATTKNGVKLLFAKRKRSSSEDEQEQPAKKHVQSNKRKNSSDEEIKSSLVGRRQIYHVDKDKNDKSKSKGIYKNRQQISSSEVEQVIPAKRHVKSTKHRNESDEDIESSSVGRRQKYHVDKDRNDKSKPKSSYENRRQISSSEDEREKPANKHVQSNKRKDTSDEDIESSLVGRRQIYHVDKDRNDKSKPKSSYENRRQISSSEDEREKPANKHVQTNKRKDTSDEDIESSLVGRRQIYDKYDKNKSKTRPRIIVSEDDMAESVNGKKMQLRSGKRSPVKSGNALTPPKGTRKSLRSYINNKQEINRQTISSSEDKQDVKNKTVKSTKHRNESDEDIESSLVGRRRIDHVDKDRNDKSKSKGSYKNRPQISSSEDEQEKPAKKHVQSNKGKNTSDEDIESSLVGRRRIDHVDKDKNDKSKSKGIRKSKQQISSSEDGKDVRNKNVESTKHGNESDEETGTSLAGKRQTYDKYDKNKPKTKPQIIISSEDDRVEPVNGKKLPLRSEKQGPVKSGNVLKSPKVTRKSLRSYIDDKKEIDKPDNNQTSRSSNVDNNGVQTKPAGESSKTIEEMLEIMFNTKPTRRPKRKLSSDDESYREERSSKRTNREIVSKSTKETENGDDSCKELLITEEDIQLLRTFIENDKDNIFNVDLEMFDTDDNHKRAIFYKLNPLVNVARCERVATMLRGGRDQSATVSLEDFISTLGLRSVLDSTSQASSKYRMRARRKPDEADKENKRSSPRKWNASSSRSVSQVLVEKVRGSGNKKKTISTKRKAVGLIGKMSSRPLRSRKIVEVDLLSSDSDSVFEKSKQGSALETRKRVTSEVSGPEAAALKRDSLKVVAKTSRTAYSFLQQSRKANGRFGGKMNGRFSGKAGGREYSRAEDEAVVAWVRGAERARRVNGNQLWRELQPLHQQRTGHFRSWHSLRNRYLRYLLPSLGEMALPPPEAVRLRAAAASGELKSRKNPQRANSLLREPRVRSAWSRRPRPPTRESSSSSPSPSRPASPARPPTHASSSSLSPPARASSHNSSHSDSTSSRNSSASSRDSRPKDRRSSLRNSSAKKSATTRTQSPRKLRSSSQKSPRTPTYAQLTRRFADERAPHSADLPRPRASHSADLPRPRAPHSADLPRPRAPPSDDQPRPRTRRLYNPNAT